MTDPPYKFLSPELKLLYQTLLLKTTRARASARALAVRGGGVSPPLPFGLLLVGRVLDLEVDLGLHELSTLDLEDGRLTDVTQSHQDCQVVQLAEANRQFS